MHSRCVPPLRMESNNTRGHICPFGQDPPMDEIANIIMQIFLLLVFAKVLGSVFERYHMPKLIGEILAGVVFVNLAILFPDAFHDLLGFSVEEFDDPDSPGGLFFEIMGELGIIFLLFAVGLETKFGDLMKVGKTATYIAVLGLIIPFAGGLMFIFYETIGFDAALLIGTALFGMSTAVSVECLRNLGAMKSSEAKLIVGASIIDDILCLALLGVIVGIIEPGTNMIKIVLNAAVVAAFVLLMFLFISRAQKLADRRRRLRQRIKEIVKHDHEVMEAHPVNTDAERNMHELGALGLAVIVCLGLAALSMTIGLAAIIGAFLAGMLFAEFRETVPVEHNFNIITYFMLPFFFLYVGMKVHLNVITLDIIMLLGAVVAVAVLTKYVAGRIGGKLGKLSGDVSHLIGVSMIPRGEVGIIVATIGIKNLVFGPDMFTVIILMALITSIITPPLVTRAYRKIEKNRSAVFEEIFLGDHIITEETAAEAAQAEADAAE